MVSLARPDCCGFHHAAIVIVVDNIARSTILPVWRRPKP